jgi:Flp pilus assembly CpaF family ATPase
MSPAPVDGLRVAISTAVSEGIVRRGGEALGDLERRTLIEDLAQTAATAAIAEMIHGGHQPPSTTEEAELVRDVVDHAIGLGPLQRLLDDESIENIDVNGWNNVWLKFADGTKEPGPLLAASDAELVEWIQRLVRSHHSGGERRVDISRCWVDVLLPGGHRMSVMLGVSDRPAVSIRCHRLIDATLADFADAMTSEVAGFLAAAVRAQLNIVIAGPVDAGKTTLLRALLAELDPTVRIITVEVSYELGLHELPHRHCDVSAWEARDSNSEGQGEVTMADLVRRGNRHDADRLIVGEVLGDEIVPMLQAMTNGLNGSMCTIHAESSEGAFEKMMTHTSQAPRPLTREATARMIASGVDLIIYAHKKRDGNGRKRRFVSSIRSVDGSDGQSVISTELFAEPAGGGPAEPRFSVPPGLRDRLLEVGWEPSFQWSPR